jgi:hypothetical protein
MYTTQKFTYYCTTSLYFDAKRFNLCFWLLVEEHPNHVPVADFIACQIKGKNYLQGEELEDNR